MSTYDMIVEEGIEKGLKINEDLLIKERIRAEEERLRAEEEHLRAEEERLKAKEERQRLDNVIIYLHDVAQLPLEEIAHLSGHHLEYIKTLILAKNKEE